jgi:hypothetical protein
MKALDSLTLSLSSTPNTSVTFGNYPPEKVLVEMSIMGTINMTSHPNAWYAKYNGPLDARGIFIGGVYQQCSMNVLIGVEGLLAILETCSVRRPLGPTLRS